MNFQYFIVQFNLYYFSLEGLIGIVLILDYSSFEPQQPSTETQPDLAAEITQLPILAEVTQQQSLTEKDDVIDHTTGM